MTQLQAVQHSFLTASGPAVPPCEKSYQQDFLSFPIPNSCAGSLWASSDSPLTSDGHISPIQTRDVTAGKVHLHMYDLPVFPSLSDEPILDMLCVPHPAFAFSTWS